MRHTIDMYRQFGATCYPQLRRGWLLFPEGGATRFTRNVGTNVTTHYAASRPTTTLNTIKQWSVTWYGWTVFQEYQQQICLWAVCAADLKTLGSLSLTWIKTKVPGYIAVWTHSEKSNIKSAKLFHTQQHRYKRHGTRECPTALRTWRDCRAVRMTAIVGLCYCPLHSIIILPYYNDIAHTCTFRIITIMHTRVHSLL